MVNKIRGIICSCLIVASVDAMRPASLSAEGTNGSVVSWKNVPVQIQEEIKKDIAPFCFDNFSALISCGQGFLSDISDVTYNIQIVFFEDHAVTIGMLPTEAFKHEGSTLARFNVQSIRMQDGNCILSTDFVSEEKLPIWTPEPKRYTPRILNK